MNKNNTNDSPNGSPPRGGVRGITFRGGAKGGTRKEEAKVKTKAKKKQYITGAHGSGAAKKKADIRRQRANRHK